MKALPGFHLLLLLLLWSCQSESPQVALDVRLERHVRHLSEVSPPRNHRHPETLREVAGYIRKRLAMTKHRGKSMV